MLIQIHDVQPHDQCFLIFGRNKVGESVCFRVNNVKSHFYIRPFDGDYKGVDVDIKNLNSAALSQIKRSSKCRSYQCTCNNSSTIEQFGPDLYSICATTKDEYFDEAPPIVVYRGENVAAKSMIGYTAKGQNYVKVICKSYGVQKLLKRELIKDRFFKKYEIMEAAIDPLTRFMTDNNLVGNGFVEVKAADCKVPSISVTRCKHEFVCQSPSCLLAHNDLLVNFPLHVLSFDIECCSIDLTQKNKFPKAEDGDPVIQIGVVAEKLFGDEAGKKQKIVFCLKETDDIENGDIRYFETERDLLLAFYNYCFNEFEADIIAGYNSNQFDMPYLIERAKQCKLGSFAYFSKMRSRQMYMWKQKFESAQSGTRMTMQFNSPGVVFFDVFNYIKKTMNLQSYSLKNVAIELLNGDEKEDLPYKNIAPYFLDGPKKRSLIASYCLQDTVLVAMLYEKQKMISNNIEFSRICGVLFQHSVEKGVSFKILRKLLEYTTSGETLFLIPTFKRNSEGHQIIEYYDEIVNDKAEYVELSTSKGQKRKLEQIWNENCSETVVDSVTTRKLKYQGATVLEPEKGFHDNPVATLDFASLYPSEMRMHNLCTTTLLQSEDHAKELGLKSEDYEIVASGFIFVKKHIFQGILPKIESELHAARKAAKKELKAAKHSGDVMLASVLDGKQLAIKLIMNSIYGFCGSYTSPIAALPIAISITAQGRHDILNTKAWIEENFKKIFPDAPGDAKVIYGDTDSVMIKFIGLKDVKKAAEYSEELEKRINDTSVGGLFEMPMYLEFEKIFYPYFLLKKKKYCGMKFDAGDMDNGKLSYSGVETKRRDPSKLCRTTQKTFMDKLIVNNDKKGALQYLQNRVNDLMNGRIDNSEFVLSKKLSKFTYKNKQPHTEVAKKLRKIDPLNAPELGDRVEFVIVSNDKKRIAEKAEPVSETHKHLIDYEYYKEKQLKVPMERLTIPLIGKAESDKIFSTKKSSKLRNQQQKVGFNRLFRIKN